MISYSILALIYLFYRTLILWINFIFSLCFKYIIIYLHDVQIFITTFWIFVNILATDYKYHIVSYFIRMYKYYFFIKILLIDKFLKCYYFEIIYRIYKYLYTHYMKNRKKYFRFVNLKNIIINISTFNFYFHYINYENI